MSIKQNDLKQRTKEFALNIVKFVESLPNVGITKVLGRQLLRAGTSVGANYRSACRARSNADFIYKMGLVEEEADESLFWMELLIGSELVSEQHLHDLIKEADELIAITVSSINTAKKGGRS